MITATFQAIIDKLEADATLLTYLGGAYVFRGKATRAMQVPSITLTTNTEKATHRAGYNSNRVRDLYPTLQVDVWVSSEDAAFPCTGEDADTIENRVDAVLMSSSPVSGTILWQKISASQQYEQDTRIWHNAIRYSFRYTTTDT